MSLTKAAFVLWLGLAGGIAIGAGPIDNGAAIPGAKLVSHTGKSIDITKYASQSGKRNLLLLFFRTGTCNVCVSQLRDIAANYDEVTKANAAVLALSLDDAITHSRTAGLIENKYPLLLDPDGKTVKAFGVFNPEDNLSRPSVYLIGPDQKVLYHYVGKSLADRPPLNEVLEVVRHYSGGLPKRDTAPKARP
jgi:peroxiredoxin